MKPTQRLEKLETIARAKAEKTKTMLQLLTEAFEKWGHLPDSEAPRHFVRIKELLKTAKERKENESQNPTATP
jgi:acyl-CoA reductase-like NAD-dependent aldehyde dehydrogenase